MLLDRKRIRKWAKWVALVLAIIFAISFVAIGVGQGQGSLNVFDALACSGKSATTQASTADQKIATYQQALKTNPKDTDALLGLANLYQQIYDSGQSSGNAALLQEANYLQQYIDAAPTQIDVYLRLARLYASTPVNNNKAAVDVLNKAVSQAPTNADVFLQLGIAEKSLGNTSAAVMAWQKYLELQPNGDQASVIKDQIKVLTETTTTTAPSTTTTAGSSSTTASGTATTSGAATTTTVGFSTTTAK